MKIKIELSKLAYGMLEKFVVYPTTTKLWESMTLLQYRMKQYSSWSMDLET